MDRHYNHIWTEYPGLEAHIFVCEKSSHLAVIYVCRFC